MRERERTNREAEKCIKKERDREREKREDKYSEN